MIRTSKSAMVRSKAIRAAGAALLLASLGVPTHGAESGSLKPSVAQPRANGASVASIPSDAPDAAAATPRATSAVGSPAPVPSLEKVMELLQQQGEEIAALRAALRDQQELTARLEAKLNVAGAP